MRYRFFLYAGLLPYLLGAAWAYAVAGTFDAALFWSGLGGVVLAVIGVEAFNEYFDARMGTDRVFNPDRRCRRCRDARVLDRRRSPSPARSRSASISRLRLGWPILAFALLGGAGGDLLRGAADPLVVPRAGRAR